MGWREGGGGGRKGHAYTEKKLEVPVSSKERMKTGNTFLKCDLEVLSQERPEGQVRKSFYQSDPILLHFLLTAR